MPVQFKIQATIHKDIKTVWKAYHEPKHIVNWNFASSDWHTPYASSEFKVGGKFNYRMEAKDGSFGFDFTGVFDIIEPHHKIKYHMEDEREVSIEFSTREDKTSVKVIVDAETENSVAMQKRGWQSILNHFKTYVEGLN